MAPSVTAPSITMQEPFRKVPFMETILLTSSAMSSGVPILLPGAIFDTRFGSWGCEETKPGKIAFT